MSKRQFKMEENDCYEEREGKKQCGTSDEVAYAADFLVTDLPLDVIYQIVQSLGPTPYHILAELMRTKLAYSRGVFRAATLMLIDDINSGTSEAGLPEGDAFACYFGRALQGKPPTDYAFNGYADTVSVLLRGAVSNFETYVDPAPTSRGEHIRIYGIKRNDSALYVFFRTALISRQYAYDGKIARIVSYENKCANVRFCCEHVGCVRKGTAEQCECTVPCPCCKLPFLSPEHNCKPAASDFLTDEYFNYIADTEYSQYSARFFLSTIIMLHYGYGDAIDMVSCVPKAALKCL